MVQVASANGGGYFRGGVEHTGDVAGFEPKETEKIRILDENLTIQLGDKAADVEVRYLMHNETDNKVKVRFGFPVEESFDRDFNGSDSPAPTGNKLRYCQNYTISAAGKAIASKWQIEKKPGDDKRFQGIAGWLISEITFAAGEEKPVMIHFTSGYPSEIWSVSSNDSESPALFRYRLSTAACWAGTMKSGRITLKPAGIDPRELSILKPVNRFKKEGDNWVWSFEDLEPTLADDLEIEAAPKIQGHRGAKTSRYIQRGDQWLMSHTNYEVKASSVLAPEDNHSYEAANVKSYGNGEPWSEGKDGPGVGEWLELKPVEAKPLAAIAIRPGLIKDMALFKANARPKKILINLNDEHSFSVIIPDSPELFRIPVVGYSKAVKKIRMTFEEVYPGDTFEDMCVSSIRLEAKLDKKPKLEPSR